MKRQRTDARLKEFARQLRKNSTYPEKRLWQELRCKRMGARFQRQRALYGYILDFWCPKAKLCIEVDGAHHDEPDQRVHDDRRDRMLGRYGILTLRFCAAEVTLFLSTVTLA